MTPLEFYIAAKNEDANAAVDQLAQKVGSLKEKTESLYEGPAREMKIRTEIEGMIKDMAMGQTATDALVNAFSRLSEVARFAGPIAAIIATVVGITNAEYDAYKAAIKFSEAYQDAMTGDVKNMSIDQINETLRKLEEAEKEYAARGWLERIMEGSAGGDAKKRLDDRQADLLAGLDDRQAQKINDETALKGKPDSEQKIAEINDKYGTLIDEAQAKGQFDTAMAYMNARRQEIEDVKEAEQKANDEVAAQKAKVTGDLNAELIKAQRAAATASAGEDLTALGQQYSELLHQIDGATGDDKIRLQIAAAEMSRKLSELQSTSDRENANKQAAAETKSQNEAVVAQTKITNLRRDVLKAEFDALSKEEKLIALRAEQAKLQQLMAAQPGGDQNPEYLTLKKLYLENQRAIGGLEAAGERLPMDSFEQAGGRYAGVNYGSVNNEKANRAEGQRDTMITLLRSISTARVSGDVSAF